jgi:hypothetical protein
MDYLMIMASVIANCCTLMLTGRLFNHINSEIEVTWSEDAQAAGVIVGLSMLASLVVSFIGLPSILVFFIYIYLIYHAFQLDGLGDILIFYFMYGAIGYTVNLLGLSPIVLLLMN